MYYENYCYFDMPIDIDLLCYGKRVKPFNHHHGPAIRDNYWLIYIEEGKGEYVSNGKSFKIEDKYIMATFPKNKFKYQLSAQKDVKIYWICFEGKSIMDLFETFNITPDHPVVKVEESSKIEKIIKQLVNITSSDNINDKFISLALIYTLFSLLVNKEYVNTSYQDHISKAYKFIQCNYSEGIGIQDIANSLNLDRAYFSKLFKSKAGMSPSEYLTYIRMKEACRLLKNNISVTETAYSVGISDPLYFSRIFSKTYGVSPSKYKKNLCNSNN